MCDRDRATAGLTAGSMPTTGTAWRSRSGAMAAIVAVLQATISIFAPSATSAVGDRERARHDLLGRPPAVRAVRLVGDVDELLVGQLCDEVDEHGEPADPRVEHADHRCT